MDASVFAQWIATAVIACGLLVTLYRNGRSQSKKYGSLETKVDNVDAKVDEVARDVKSLDKKLDASQLNCVEKTTAFSEKIHTLEREMSDLRNK